MSRYLCIGTLLLAMLILTNGAYAATCGGTTPCSCGDTLTTSRTLTASDPVTTTPCPWNGLEINTSIAILDCGGRSITGSPTGMNGVYTPNLALLYVTIKNCRISNFYNGILMGSTSALTTISSNTITGNTYAGILINGSIGNNTIKHNVVSNNDATYAVGIWMINSMANDVVVNNTANSNAWGIAVEDTAGVQVENNTANSNTNSGIDIYYIRLSTIENNTLLSNGKNGIKVWGGAFSNSLLRNTVRLNGIGIELDSSAATHTIDSNTVCNSTTNDFSVASSGHSGTNNKCDNAAGWNDQGTTGCTTSCAAAPLPPPSACADGTTYGQCSSTLPQYCQSGTLVNNCSTCGCPTGQSCNTTSEGCYIPPTPTCTDGTPYGQCSAVTMPYYCLNGTLVNRCTVCNCPPTGTCNPSDEICYPACADGTPYYQCSITMPQFCDGGTLVDKCQVCRCPAGQTCDTATNSCYTGTTPPVVLQCSGDADCESGNYCETGSCVAQEPSGAACDRDGQCTTGRCADSTCVECLEDTECSDTQRCEDYACADIICPEGDIVDRGCVPYECTEDASCAETQECVSNKCIELVCPEGQVARAHACVGAALPAPADSTWLYAAAIVIIIILVLLAVKFIF